MQISCGVSEEKIKAAIASWIDALPNCDSERVEEIRRKYSLGARKNGGPG